MEPMKIPRMRATKNVFMREGRYSGKRRIFDSLLEIVNERSLCIPFENADIGMDIIATPKKNVAMKPFRIPLLLIVFAAFSSSLFGGAVVPGFYSSI